MLGWRVAGLNLNGCDLSAAIGRVQLRKLPASITRRRAVATAISDGIQAAGLHAFTLGSWPAEAEPSHWFLRINVDPAAMAGSPSAKVRLLLRLLLLLLQLPLLPLLPLPLLRCRRRCCHCYCAPTVAIFNRSRLCDQGAHSCSPLQEAKEKVAAALTAEGIPGIQPNYRYVTSARPIAVVVVVVCMRVCLCGGMRCVVSVFVCVWCGVGWCWHWSCDGGPVCNQAHSIPSNQRAVAAAVASIPPPHTHTPPDSYIVSEMRWFVERTAFPGSGATAVGGGDHQPKLPRTATTTTTTGAGTAAAAAADADTHTHTRTDTHRDRQTHTTHRETHRDPHVLYHMGVTVRGEARLGMMFRILLSCLAMAAELPWSLPEYDGEDTMGDNCHALSPSPIILPWHTPIRGAQNHSTNCHGQAQRTSSST